MLIVQPPFRKLRGYAFDPSLSLQMDTAVINDVVYKVSWEDLEPGPAGEYIEVIDYDPSVNSIYSPVDLNDIYILASDGLDPSESNPMFHQQMVYAVAMTTIKHFEMALGRKAMWSPRRILIKGNKQKKKYVRKLRIYPHGLREANAYYSPQKKSLLFGYFSSEPSGVSLQMPGSIVFTCLSHDIIAHETTHALLDGMHSSYTSPTNPDVLAFHEAFADIVALFQHFTFADVLKHQIAKTRGNLENQNLLGELAQEFGKALGHYGALRDAIGEIDETTNQWKLKIPDPSDYLHTTEPHARGSILVAAVFDAFLNIYKRRVADLLRIATGGTGILPEGAIHPDLVNRLSAEASKTSGHILRMCVRALDYSPTTDITFGDYLRAIITADVDLLSDDSRDYRLAFIEAFRKRGIYPEGIKSLSIDSLIYKPENIDTLKDKFKFLGAFLREYREAIYYLTHREKIFDVTNIFMGGGELKKDNQTDFIKGLHPRINSKFDETQDFEELTGLVFTEGWKKLGIRTSTASKPDSASFQVHSLNLANRVGPTGKIINHIVLTLVQRCGVICRKNEETDEYTIKTYVPNKDIKPPNDGFEFKGSCTLIFDLDSLELKYVIRKPLLDLNVLKATGKKELDKNAVTRQYQYMFEETAVNEFQAYFSDSVDNTFNEPFSFLHNTI